MDDLFERILTDQTPAEVMAVFFMEDLLYRMAYSELSTIA